MVGIWHFVHFHVVNLELECARFFEESRAEKRGCVMDVLHTLCCLGNFMQLLPVFFVSLVVPRKAAISTLKDHFCIAVA